METGAPRHQNSIPDHNTGVAAISIPHYPSPMRLRNRYDGKSLFWIGLCLLQIATRPGRLHHLSRTNSAWAIVDGISLAIWICLLILYAVQPWTNFWSVTPAGIRYRKLWVTREIPFTRIAAIRPADLLGGNVEIEVAPVDKDVYPHEYIPASPRNLEVFLKAVATYAPQTLTEP